MWTKRKISLVAVRMTHRVASISHWTRIEEESDQIPPTAEGKRVAIRRGVQEVSSAMLVRPIVKWRHGPCDIEPAVQAALEALIGDPLATELILKIHLPAAIDADERSRRCRTTEQSKEKDRT